AFHHFLDRLAVDLHRAAVLGPIAPLCNIVVVRAPIRHLAAAEGVPPTEVPMTILAVVREHRRLTDVEVPIQSFGNRFLREGSADGARRQADDDVLKLPDTPIAN